MNVTSQKRIASRVLKCGQTRVWIDPSRVSEVAEAITTGDVKRLIISGAIKETPKTGTSRARAKKTAIQKAKGKQKGHGSRKGKKTARMPRKQVWMTRVRALRNELRALDTTKQIDHANYRHLYRMISAGTFRSKAHLHLYLQEHDMMKKGA